MAPRPRSLLDYREHPGIAQSVGPSFSRKLPLDTHFELLLMCMHRQLVVFGAKGHDDLTDDVVDEARDGNFAAGCRSRTLQFDDRTCQLEPGESGLVPSGIGPRPARFRPRYVRTLPGFGVGP